ncbi:MAG: hypothetical protein WDO69_02925 [Pseudomonadota bacterium]
MSAARRASWQLLSMPARDHVLKRTGERSLEMPLADWTVQILEESAGRPTRFSVSFDRSVDDPSISVLI